MASIHNSVSIEATTAIIAPYCQTLGSPIEPVTFIPGLSDPVVLEVSSPSTAEVFELAIERGAYPALRSWAESAPPRPNSVV